MKSSVAAGTPLRGLNYFKGKDDPIALEDHEYPDWLWELLTEQKKTVAGEEGKDPRLYGTFTIGMNQYIVEDANTSFSQICKVAKSGKQAGEEDGYGKARNHGAARAYI